MAGGGGDSSSDEEAPSQPIVTVAMGRSRRATAGNRMAALLEKAEQDDFYRTTYGGFEEAGDEDDPDFAEKPGEEEDVFDSDFGDSEGEGEDGAKGGDRVGEPEEDYNDEDDDDEAAKKKRKRAMFVASVVKDKAKKPVAKKTKAAPKTAALAAELEPELEPQPDKAPVASSLAVSGPKGLLTPRGATSPRRRAKRQSTAVKSAEIEERVKQREKRRKRQMETFLARQKLLAESHREMTQEELLAEAKETERVNLKSLQRHERLEEDKKKTVVRRGLRGRFIRVHSMRMPLIEELDSARSPPAADSEEDDVRVGVGVGVAVPGRYHERTFVSFPDEKAFRESFPDERRPSSKRAKRSLRRILCPITAKPARYRDPVTKVPYHDAFAFRTIREAYALALEQKGSRSNEGVVRWLRWRREQVERRQKEALTTTAAAAVATTVTFGVDSNDVGVADAETQAV